MGELVSSHSQQGVTYIVTATSTVLFFPVNCLLSGIDNGTFSNDYYTNNPFKYDQELGICHSLKIGWQTDLVLGSTGKVRNWVIGVFFHILF